MSKRRMMVAALSGVLALGLLWFALASHSRSFTRAPPKLPYRARGVTISAVPPGGLAGAEMVQASGGDFLVQNGRLSFVVGGDAPSLERRGRHGALLDLVFSDFQHDELVELRPLVRSASKPLGLNMVGVTVVTDESFPFIRVEQASGDGWVRLATDFKAAPRSNKLELVTRLYNGGSTPLRGIEIGERTRWPGAPTFAPRVGFPKLTSRAEVPWIVRQGVKLSYGLAFPNGPVEAAFFFDRIGQVGQETLAHFGEVPPGVSLEHRRQLFVVEGDLGKAAELAMQVVGRDLGFVEGRLDPSPSWGIVEARYPDGKLALVVRVTRDGRYRLPLPAGDYRLVLRTPGGEDDAEISVSKELSPVVPKLIAPIPGRLHFSVTDQDGAALAVRLVVRGVEPTKDPEFGPIDQGSGARNVVYTRRGTGEVELPPGRYTLVFSHGSEYEISEHDLEVDGENGAAIHTVLARSVDTRGWVACDFHLHSAPSHDSNVTLEDRVLSLLSEGIEFAVPTDHNHVTDYRDAMRFHSAGVELATTSGVEVTTTTWGHFNAYPYPSRAPPPPYSAVSPIEIFAAIRARAPGAVIQVNHPRMPGVGYFNRIELNRDTGGAATEGASFEFDAIEVVNGYDLEAPKLIEDNLSEFFSLLNFGRRYTAVGNSDSHRLVINWAGYPRTYVRVEDERPGQLNPTQIARAVLEGHAVVANGIFVAVAANGTGGPGDTLRGRRVTLQMEARAPTWVDIQRIELWVNGVRTAASPRVTAGNAGRLAWQTELDFKEDSWVVVIARGDRPMTAVFPGRRVLPFGFTNPIFVDADADGAFRAPGSMDRQPR